MLTTTGRPYKEQLAQFWSLAKRPWMGAAGWPLFRWLTPNVFVQLARPHGAPSVWQGRDLLTLQPGNPKDASKARFFALGVDESHALVRSISLPPLPDKLVRSAVELQVRSFNPFPEGDMAWGYRIAASAGHGFTVRAAVASRQHIARQLAELAQRPDTQAEWWVISDHDEPIVLQGFAEHLRAAYLARHRGIAVALLVALALVLAAAALTPTVQLRLQATQAVFAYDELVRATKPLVAKREQLLQVNTQLDTVSGLINDRIDALRLLETITRVLPDDTYLGGVNIQGLTVNLAGFTPNTAALMQRLSAESGLKDVKAPSPATRPPGATKETFNIEFTFVRPEATPGPTPDTRPVPVPALDAASAAKPPASSPAAASSAPALPASAATAPAATTSLPASAKK